MKALLQLLGWLLVAIVCVVGILVCLAIGLAVFVGLWYCVALATVWIGAGFGVTLPIWPTTGAYCLLNLLVVLLRGKGK